MHGLARRLAQIRHVGQSRLAQKSAPRHPLTEFEQP